MSVHVIDQGADAPTSAETGDIVLRRGEQIEVLRVTDGGPEPLGTVPAGTIDLDSSPEDLEIAARGVETALANRGG